MSVSPVARRHGIGANQIFTWRRLMLAACFGFLLREAIALTLKAKSSKHSYPVIRHYVTAATVAGKTGRWSSVGKGFGGK
jgi:hypothetical protein